jgi:hypothetical protein
MIESKVTATETLTVSGVEIKIVADNTISGCGPVVHITLTRDGKILADGADYLIYGKLKPETREMVRAAAHRAELASRGITPEQDAQRIADLDAYDESYAKTMRALNM